MAKAKKQKLRKLTGRQINFCEEYLIHGIGSLAYKKAYDTDNDASARALASETLSKPSIQAYLERRRKEIKDALKVTPEKVVQAHAQRAFFDPRSLLDPETGELIPLHRLPKTVASGITKLKVRQLKPLKTVDEETGLPALLDQSVVELEWDNGNASREALGKIFGLYKKDHEQANDGLMTAGELIRAIREDISGTNLGLPSEEDMNID